MLTGGKEKKLRVPSKLSCHVPKCERINHQKILRWYAQIMKYYPYPCERCGACCRHVDLVAQMQSFNRGDGVCKYLTADNLCAIYAERPPLCNGEQVYKKFFADMTVEEFHGIISQLCKKLRRRELEELHQKISDA